MAPGPSRAPVFVRSHFLFVVKIFSDSMAGPKIKHAKIMCNINDSVCSTGLFNLSENYLTQKFITQSIWSVKYSRITVCTVYNIACMCTCICSWWCYVHVIVIMLWFCIYMYIVTVLIKIVEYVIICQAPQCKVYIPAVQPKRFSKGRVGWAWEWPKLEDDNNYRTAWTWLPDAIIVV